MKAKHLYRIASVLALSVALSAGSSARADVNLWIDDASGNIGLVDLTTHTVSHVNNTGQLLTDIGFVGTQLYGTTFTGLYKISTTTGASTAVGSGYGAVGGGGVNALVGDGASLLGASNTTSEVYTISPSTGLATNFKASPLPSAGDLAFVGTTLYESAVGANGLDELVNVTTGHIVGTFSTHSSSVFGLADDGTTLYAVDGTEVYSVDPATAALTPLFNYGGLSALGAANGAAFVAENVTPGVPEPSTWAMMIVGFAGLGFAGHRRVRKVRATLEA